MTDNTLKITFREADEHRSAARDRLHRAEAGETDETIEQDARFVLDFEEFGEVERLMRRSNLELVKAIATEQPASIRATAAVVDRDYKDVHRNLNELESLGVIEFESEGARKRPILRAGAEAVDLSFRWGDTGNGRTKHAEA